MDPAPLPSGMIDDDTLAAGEFGNWITDMQLALRGEQDATVPCGDCTACCTSSQFVHIAPDETETLARIPDALHFAAPRMPRGHVLLGYDERGHCPMLVDGACSIYEHRPRTCRTYDCRVFPAAGVEDDDESKQRITLRARRWRFDYATPNDETRHAAVVAAATYLQEQAEGLDERDRPMTTTQLAVLAVEIHDLLVAEVQGPLRQFTPAVDGLAVEIARRRGRPAIT